MDRRSDIAISIVFILFGIFVILEARTIKTPLFPDPIGPRAVFYACGAIFILGGIVNVAQRVRGWRLFPSHMVPAEGVADEPGHPSSFRRAALLALVSLVYVLTLRPVGYLIGTPLYIMAGLWILEQRNWLFNIVVGLVFTISFYIVFAEGLSVWLPVGPFTQLFRDLGWIIL
jgi:putative tricarboxylic transport membrane protein